MSEPESDSTTAPAVLSDGGTRASDAAAPSVLHKEVNQAFRALRNLGGSLVTTWSIALLVRFLLPRHLGPAAFGELAYADVVASAMLLLASLGIDTYTSREIAVRPEHAGEYFGGVVAIRSVIAAFVLVAVVVFLSARGKTSDVVITGGVFWLYNGTMGFNSTIATMLRAVGHTGRLAIANVIAKLVWGVGIAAAVWLLPREAPLWVYAVPATVGEVVRMAMTLPYAAVRLALNSRVNVTATSAVLASSFPFFLSTLSSNLGGPLNFAVLDYSTSDKRELGWYGSMLSLASLGMMFSPLLEWVLLPLLSRARARSSAEVGTIVGFAVEGFVLCVLPITLLGVLGAEFWIELAFGSSYLPAALAFRFVILTLVVTYTAMILFQGLVASGFTWSLSSLSLLTVILAPTLSWLAVPWMGRLFGTGGQAAGAALANGLPECLVVTVALFKLDERARSPRLRSVMVRALLVCVAVALADHFMRGLGHARLALDLALYGVLLLAIGAVKVRDVRRALDTLRAARS